MAGFARDSLHASTATSRSILLIGAGIHFFACFKLYGRRGFPEVDPFWLAMVWLWVPPIIISAIFTRLSRARIRDLLIYAFPTAFTVSWATIFMVPSYKTPIHALFGMIGVFPAQLVGIVIVELVSQAVLYFLRRFIPREARCEVCGYILKYLPSPRCPECGTSFDPKLLKVDYSPVVTPVVRRWTTYLLAAVCVATLLFPNWYRQRAFSSSRFQGSQIAELDWARGEVTWYVPESEIRAMSQEQQEKFESVVFRIDPSSGFRVHQMWPDWQHEQFQSAYREVIEGKLEKAGRPKPGFWLTPPASSADTTAAKPPSTHPLQLDIP